ncbi:MAG: QueT transporter family protein [Candidatus Bathyarchaeota archaeon]|nr:QueT transporter family protein [Candidatus Bathyarchaeota archaeon]
MLDLVSMWKNPKMISYFAVTAVLYPALIYPFQNFNVFAGDADYLRLGMGIPMAFSFLFGPAAAWGTAVGNLIYDASTGGLNPISVFGFVGNFLIAYLPYKLWAAMTNQKPDLKSPKKIGLFVALAVLACTICGLIIGYGLLWLYSLPFVMTSFMIIASDALWAIVLGAILLALGYGFFSHRKLLYQDLLGVATVPSWNRAKSLAILVFVVSASLCFVLPGFFSVDLLMLLPFVASAVIAVLAVL